VHTRRAQKSQQSAAGRRSLAAASPTPPLSATSAAYSSGERQHPHTLGRHSTEGEKEEEEEAGGGGKEGLVRCAFLRRKANGSGHSSPASKKVASVIAV